MQKKRNSYRKCAILIKENIFTHNLSKKMSHLNNLKKKYDKKKQ